MIHSEGAIRIHDLIVRAIDAQQLTMDEYCMILTIASEDGYVDPEEEAMLGVLHDMLEDRMIRISPG